MGQRAEGQTQIGAEGQVGSVGRQHGRKKNSPAAVLACRHGATTPDRQAGRQAGGQAGGQAGRRALWRTCVEGIRNLSLLGVADGAADAATTLPPLQHQGVCKCSAVGSLPYWPPSDGSSSMPTRMHSQAACAGTCLSAVPEGEGREAGALVPGGAAAAAAAGRHHNSGSILELSRVEERRWPGGDGWVHAILLPQQAQRVARLLQPLE